MKKCKVEDYLIVHCQNIMKTKGVEMKTMKHFKGCVKRNGNLPFARMTIPLWSWFLLFKFVFLAHGENGVEYCNMLSFPTQRFKVIFTIYQIGISQKIFKIYTPSIIQMTGDIMSCTDSLWKILQCFILNLFDLCCMFTCNKIKRKN